MPRKVRTLEDSAADLRNLSERVSENADILPESRRRRARSTGRWGSTTMPGSGRRSTRPRGRRPRRTS